VSNAAETRPKKTNRIGFDVIPYRGNKSTLCAGCGHNAVSERLVDVFWEMGVAPWDVAKFSGIGCSSKSPAYFLGMAHGFNAVHGRAPAVATGAILANHRLKGIVVTGDGDTVSIGLGQFMHMLRRNVPLIYVIENNGVYGLTKGQFSATADIGSRLKTGIVNDLPPIDVCILAIELGATLVARSFSGDKRQLQAILKACIAHRGLSVVDIVSPCVTFNDHEGSTKSYGYMRDHDEPLHDLNFVPFYEDISVEIEDGAVQEVELHDGSKLRIHKLARDYDPTDRLHALEVLHQSASSHEVLTGILYVDSQKENFTDLLGMGDAPLATLPIGKTRPARAVLEEIIEELR
jgi:2-oxoglutarate/2-oxoacid ferredoxin oxidoreductase subunit beta